MPYFIASSWPLPVITSLSNKTELINVNRNRNYTMVSHDSGKTFDFSGVWASFRFQSGPIYEVHHRNFNPPTAWKAGQQQLRSTYNPRCSFVRLLCPNLVIIKKDLVSSPTLLYFASDPHLSFPALLKVVRSKSYLTYSTRLATINVTNKGCIVEIGAQGSYEMHRWRCGSKTQAKLRAHPLRMNQSRPVCTSCIMMAGMSRRECLPCIQKRAMMNRLSFEQLDSIQNTASWLSADGRCNLKWFPIPLISKSVPRRSEIHRQKRNDTNYPKIFCQWWEVPCYWDCFLTIIQVME